MNKKHKTYCISLFIHSLLFISSFSFAQQSKTDVLLSLLKKDREDTTKVTHLNKLSEAYFRIGSYDTSLHCGNAALQLAHRLNFKKGIANSYNNIGLIYSNHGNYSKALDYYLKALKIDEDLGNKNGIATRLGNIGLVYDNQGDYPKALDYYLKALKIDEDLGNKNGVSRHLSNIGNVYTVQKDFPKVLNYYFKALKIVKELDDKQKIATILGNIGGVYTQQKNFTKALDYDLKALKIGEELGDKDRIETVLGNIGTLFYEQAKELERSKIEGQRSGENKNLTSLYNKALDYYFRALKIDEELGNKNGIAIWLGNIGYLYISTKKYKKAEDYLLRTLAIDTTIEFLLHAENTHENLSELYEKMGKPAKALEYYKKAMVLKDTLFSQENKKQLVRKEMSFEFEKKEAITKAEQEKRNAVSAEELKQQKAQRNYFIVGFALVLLLALFILRSYKQKQKANNLLAEKNILIEEQKKHIEEQHKETIDSITYAKRLQQAILPPVQQIKNHFPNSFVFYHPKDIVAGDFYWMEVIDGIVFLAVADCTGHGVPGAMVSVVCSNAINRTVKEFALCDTGKILDKVTDLVLETFEKSGEQIKDGMDISFFSYNMTSKQIQWSGANNPLWYIQNGQIIEVKADKQPIGKFDIRKPFTTHTIEYSENTTLYLFTDGLPDQFGGPKGKKFMYKRFEKNLSDIHKLSMDEQQSILEKAFLDWKGSIEQVDDVTVIGIRI